MNIADAHLDALKAFGYTETEARFLYIVATHSGYFVARQFLGFAGCQLGRADRCVLEKAPDEETRPYGTLSEKWHHLPSVFAADLPAARPREYSEPPAARNRVHPAAHRHARFRSRSSRSRTYLETEPEKVRFFRESCNVPVEVLPAKIYHGQPTSQPTVRYFVDRFPMYLDANSSSSLVTFTYLQGPAVSHSEFIHHLEDYVPLFRKLSEFRFLYLSRVDFHFEKAKELFNSIVATPLGSDVSADLVRYFQVRKAWDLGHYTALTEADLIFRNEARSRFVGQRFEHLYREWKTGRIAESHIRQKFGSTGSRTIAHFSAEVLRKVREYRTQGGEKWLKKVQITALQGCLLAVLQPVAPAMPFVRSRKRKVSGTKVTPEKTPNRAGATPLFRLSAAQKVRGVAPAHAAKIVPDVFSESQVGPEEEVTNQGGTPCPS
jgi:hypothetical protein